MRLRDRGFALEFTVPMERATATRKERYFSNSASCGDTSAIPLFLAAFKPSRMASRAHIGRSGFAAPFNNPARPEFRTMDPVVDAKQKIALRAMGIRGNFQAPHDRRLNVGFAVAVRILGEDEVRKLQHEGSTPEQLKTTRPVEIIEKYRSPIHPPIAVLIVKNDDARLAGWYFCQSSTARSFQSYGGHSSTQSRPRSSK